MQADASALPDHTGFQSILPNPASRGAPSASPRTPAPAAFPAAGAAGTQGRGMHRMNKQQEDKAHKARRKKGDGKLMALFHKSCPGKWKAMI